MSEAAALVAFCAGYYLCAGLAINLGYHRVLSHRSLALHKGVERLVVTLGLPAGTPIQWAGNHRFHHAHADRPAGPLRILYDGWHRPRSNQEHAHLAPDVAADPWYRFVSRPGPYLALALAHVAIFFGAVHALFGWMGVGALWLTLVIIFNLGDAIDSVAHIVGTMPYGGPDLARNHWFLGLLCLGEGWHAHHHRFPWSARHGLQGGQWDWTWGVIRLLAAARLARDVRVPAPAQLRAALAEEARVGAA